MTVLQQTNKPKTTSLLIIYVFTHTNRSTHEIKNRYSFHFLVRTHTHTYTHTHTHKRRERETHAHKMIRDDTARHGVTILSMVHWCIQTVYIVQIPNQRERSLVLASCTVPYGISNDTHIIIIIIIIISTPLQ